MTSPPASLHSGTPQWRARALGAARRALRSCLLLCAALAPLAPSYAGEAALTAEVPGGKHKVLRLRNLPKDAKVAVAIEATGRITVSFLNEADFNRFPNPLEPVFIAPVEQTVSFSLTMPETGDYYVILDNTKGTDAQKVKMVIKAVSGAAAAKPSPGLTPSPSIPAPPAQRREF